MTPPCSSGTTISCLPLDATSLRLSEYTWKTECSTVSAGSGRGTEREPAGESKEKGYPSLAFWPSPACMQSWNFCSSTLRAVAGYLVECKHTHQGNRHENVSNNQYYTSANGEQASSCTSIAACNRSAATIACVANLEPYDLWIVTISTVEVQPSGSWNLIKPLLNSRGWTINWLPCTTRLLNSPMKTGNHAMVSTIRSLWRDYDQQKLYISQWCHLHQNCLILCNPLLHGNVLS